MLKKIESSYSLSLIFLVLFAILIRFFSFFPSVIDHDESTYIVIADALLKGQTYFVDVIDTKPAGIFLIYAVFIKIFGSSIFMLRLLSAVVLGVTAFLLYLASRKSGGSAFSGLAAGLIYLILNSIFTYYGVSPNTETFFNLFTALALWLWIDQKSLGLYMIIGLSLGIGFIIKYVVAFDALAFGLFMLWMSYQKKISWSKTILRAGFMLLGFLIPFLLSILYYQNINHLDEFFFYTLKVSSRYPDAATAWDYIKFFLDFNLRFLPIVLFSLFAVFSKRNDIWIRQFAWFWMTIVWIVVLIPGKFFAHYCIQVMLPLSFLAGSFFNIPLEERPNWLKAITSTKIGWIILGLLMALNIFFQKVDYFDKKDHPKEIAAYLKENLSPNEKFYVGNYEHILYFLLDQPSPIPYVHSSLVWRQNHVDALMIDQTQVVDGLKSLSPQFILRKEIDANNELPIQDWLDQDYELVKTVEDEVLIYKRRED